MAPKPPPPPPWASPPYRPGKPTPARLAALTREHWGIEALHWIRDVTFDEDHHQLRAGSAPQVLAGLRNLAIGALRAAGRTKAAASLRWISRSPIRVLNILGDSIKPAGIRQVRLCLSPWVIGAVRSGSALGMALHPDKRLATGAAVAVPRDRGCAVGQRDLVLDGDDQLSSCECFGHTKQPGRLVVKLVICRGYPALARDLICDAECGRDYCSAVTNELRGAGDLFRVPYKIEHRVNAVWVGIGERRSDWTYRVVDRLVCTEALDPATFLTSSRGYHDDSGSHGELCREHTYAAGRAEDQECLAGSGLGLLQSAFGCHPGGRHGAGEAQIQLVRHELQRSVGRSFGDRHVFREGAGPKGDAPELAVDEVADGETVGTGAKRLDASGTVEAEN